MRVFALGGYGKVGLPAVRLLAGSDLVTEVAVVGRSLEHAEVAAIEIGQKAVALDVDGTNEQKLASLLTGYDIIINTASGSTVPPTLRAAIRTGTHYCDVGHGTAAEQAQELASEATSAGITAIVCNGIAPGITNLMGVRAADQLEEVEQVQLGRADIFSFRSARELTPQHWINDPEESLGALHEVRDFVGWMFRRLQRDGVRSVCVYQDGRWVETDPIRDGSEVPLLQGSTITLHPYLSGDPSWNSLSLRLSRVPPVEVWHSPFPPQLNDLLREHALRVIGGKAEADKAVVSFYDTVQSDPYRWLTLTGDFFTPPQLWVTAVGRKADRATRYCCWFTAATWDVGGWFLTSAALVVAVLRILRGEMRDRGVMTADTAFEPLHFFDEVVDLLPNPPPDGRLIGESTEMLE